jgi:23S rRNA maturation-related 3'-5' exoribonuclease YhaM
MDITELLPEINQINDERLRSKVVSVWQEALEIGGWQLEDLQKMPYTLLVKDVDVTFAEHVRVVCKLCLAMEGVLKESYADRTPVDHDTLVAGALLADVGKLIEFREVKGEYEWSSTYQYLRHPFTGVALSYKHGIPEAVLHVIATHSWEGDKVKRQPESVIFHHADFTDFHLTQFKNQ